MPLSNLRCRKQNPDQQSGRASQASGLGSWVHCPWQCTAPVRSKASAARGSASPAIQADGCWSMSCMCCSLACTYSLVLQLGALSESAQSVLVLSASSAHERVAHQQL
jgi:hypothetical protein